MYEFIIGDYAFYKNAKGASQDFGPDWKEDESLTGKVSTALWAELKPHCETTRSGWRIHLDRVEEIFTRMSSYPYYEGAL